MSCSYCICIYITRGLAVYVTTSYWYLQIPSQFHYQTKTQINICTGSDSPQTSALFQYIRCLMNNWPFFLIKSNFITSLFDRITTSYSQFSNIDINCWKANGNTANDIYWQAAKQLYYNNNISKSNNEIKPTWDIIKMET